MIKDVISKLPTMHEASAQHSNPRQRPGVNKNEIIIIISIDRAQLFHIRVLIAPKMIISRTLLRSLTATTTQSTRTRSASNRQSTALH